MRKILFLSIIAILVLMLAGVASAAVDHSSFIFKYEGTQTCLKCHDAAAKDAHASNHYQWKSKVTDIVGWDGLVEGKLGGTNDFCMTPDINWLGILTTVKGEQKPGGCAQCHAGLGLKPSPEATPEQLENIDCLICHAPAGEYRRTVVKEGESSFKIVPDPGIDMLEVAKKVALPTNGNCLTCHDKAGGGPNFKRGDIEPALADATKDLDVHMAAGITCTDCHKTEKHRISGRGADLRASDYPEHKVSCNNCHGDRPHKDSKLNKHVVAIDCSTCHVPEFAKTAPTDMHRDWSASELVEAKGLYEPKITLKKNVKPVYAWWNGKSQAHKTNDPVELNKDGFLTMFKPDGSIDDPDAKIYAFKYHTANLPYDPKSKALIPPKVGIVFMKGDNEAAIKKGFEDWFKKEYTGHDFVKAERYMALFHGVAPKEKALTCDNCHSKDGVMDFKALGYEGDPKEESVKAVKIVAAAGEAAPASNLGLIAVIVLVAGIAVIVAGVFVLRSRKR